jgi:hypothetical protein
MARDAVQAARGLGFSSEQGADAVGGGVEAIYRDSKIGEIYAGANAVQKWFIARSIFGRDIEGRFVANPPETNKPTRSKHVQLEPERVPIANGFNVAIPGAHSDRLR